jgi:hypothetical protein
MDTCLYLMHAEYVLIVLIKYSDKAKLYKREPGLNVNLCLSENSLLH